MQKIIAIRGCGNMCGGSGGGGGPKRGGGGGGMPTQSDALEMAGNPEKLLADMKNGGQSSVDRAEYAKYVLTQTTAQTRNDADRANIALMKEKRRYGAEKKTYRGIEKDAKYSDALKKNDALYKKYDELKSKNRKFDQVFSAAGKRILSNNPYGKERAIKVT